MGVSRHHLCLIKAPRQAEERESSMGQWDKWQASAVLGWKLLLWKPEMANEKQV